MTRCGLTESVVEDAALAWLGLLGYGTLHRSDSAAGMLGADRSDANCRDVVVEHSLHDPLLGKPVCGWFRVREAEGVSEEEL